MYRPIIKAVDLNYCCYTRQRAMQICRWHIPAWKVDRGTAELDSTRSWSRDNNLTLNFKKTVELVFVDSLQKHQGQLPDLMTGFCRVSSLKIPGITMIIATYQSANTLAVLGLSVLVRCAESIHALKACPHRNSLQSRMRQSRMRLCSTPSTHACDIISPAQMEWDVD